MPRNEVYRSETLSIAMSEGSAKWNLRARQEDLQQLTDALGRNLLIAHQQSVETGSTAVLRIGPDEWLLFGGELTRKHLPLCSIVDVAHRTVGIDISGARSSELLSSLCPLDLDDRAFPVGRCTRTVLGRTLILLWRKGVDKFRIEVGRSLAEFVTEMLVHVAKSDVDAQPH